MLSKIQSIKLLNSKITLDILREDLLHPYISGNKFRKLKYNILQAQIENKNTLLTFGGAYSNHIAATAFAGKENNLKTIGIIRGEELENNYLENPTLIFAKSCGMELFFETREIYKKKNDLDYLEKLKSKFGNFYLIPEGGTNKLAVKGCEEILNFENTFDYISCSVGTSGTISGLINSAKPNQNILGFSSLKGMVFDQEIHKFAPNRKNWSINDDYHFGGYAKINEELIVFLNDFYANYQIPLDPIYTGKMMFGIFDLIKKNYFKENTQLLAIHSGGLQGIAGMNKLLKKQNLPLINYYDL